jgi:regulator of PEP synthase PpsR (kinase-PPPase family)
VRSDPKTIFVLSDGTGETAEKVVRAALLQFRDARVNLKMWSRVRDDEEIRDVVDRAAAAGALLVFTVVNAAQRDLLHRLATEKGLDAVDLIGALIGKMQAYLNQQPTMTPGLMHSISEEYFRRIEAIEFSVKNDDGREPRSLPMADLVLVGVSRTSKTPLSMYLAQKGLRVANVPLVPDVPPPAELFQIDQDRIFALTIGIRPLLKIRRERLRAMGVNRETSYVLREAVARELRAARDLFDRNPRWPVIDVTGRAVEETAALILDAHFKRRHAAAAGAGVGAGAGAGPAPGTPGGMGPAAAADADSVDTGSGTS